MPEFDSTIRYRDIPDFCGYKAGTDGSIWTCLHRGRRRLYVPGPNWRLKAQADKGGGYCIVSLRNRLYRVARIILQTFAGPCPKGMEACHNDGNPLNNTLSNLRWDTRRANHADKWRHGTMRCGELAHGAKLTPEIVRVLRAEYQAALGRHRKLPNGHAAALAQKHGIKPKTINKIMRGDTWAWMP